MFSNSVPVQLRRPYGVSWHCPSSLLTPALSSHHTQARRRSVLRDMSLGKAALGSNCRKAMPRENINESRHPPLFPAAEGDLGETPALTSETVTGLNKRGSQKESRERLLQLWDNRKIVRKVMVYSCCLGPGETEARGSGIQGRPQSDLRETQSQDKSSHQKEGRRKAERDGSRLQRVLIQCWNMRGNSRQAQPGGSHTESQLPRSYQVEYSLSYKASLGYNTPISK